MVGIGAVVAVDEGVLEFVAQGLGLELDDGRFEILDIGTGLFEIAVDVGVAAEDSKCGRDLVEGDRGGGPDVAGSVPLGGADLVLTVLGEGVAHELIERKELQDGRFVDDLFDDSGFENVVGELGRFG